jgi:hypothetical protein
VCFDVRVDDVTFAFILIANTLDLDGEVLIFHLFEDDGCELLVLQRVLDREAEQHAHELRCEEQNDGVHVAYHDTTGDEHDLQRGRDGILEPAGKARSFEVVDAHHLTKEIDLEKAREQKDDE